MRSSIAVLAGAITFILALGTDARGSSFYGPHVRPLDPASATLLSDAQQRSATVRNLFSKLDGSDTS